MTTKGMLVLLYRVKILLYLLYSILQALEEFNAYNANFLVFGRQIEDTYKTLDQFSLPSNLMDRFIGISESEFRLDISSREIKKHQEDSKITA